MTRDPNDVVRVASGTLIDVEAYHQVLAEAGVESKVVGGALMASFGSAIPDSIELWAHREDLDAATAAIKLYEERRGLAEPAHKHPHPVDSGKPHGAPLREEPHIPQRQSDE